MQLVLWQTPVHIEVPHRCFSVVETALWLLVNYVRRVPTSWCAEEAGHRTQWAEGATYLVFDVRRVNTAD